MSPRKTAHFEPREKMPKWKRSTLQSFKSQTVWSKRMTITLNSEGAFQAGPHYVSKARRYRMDFNVDFLIPPRCWRTSRWRTQRNETTESQKKLVTHVYFFFLFPFKSYRTTTCNRAVNTRMKILVSFKFKTEITEKWKMYPGGHGFHWFGLWRGTSLLTPLYPESARRLHRLEQHRP